MIISRCYYLHSFIVHMSYVRYNNKRSSSHLTNNRKKTWFKIQNGRANGNEVDQCLVIFKKQQQIHDIDMGNDGDILLKYVNWYNF